MNAINAKSARFVLAGAACAVALFSGSLSAQTLTGVKVDKAQVLINQPVKITMSFSLQNDVTNCGMKVNFGDGNNDYVKINQAEDVPFSLNHTYAKPGTYTVTADPTKVDSLLRCNGKNKTTTVVVSASAPVAVAAAAPGTKLPPPTAAPAMVNPCPEGWLLDKAGVSRTTGAFICRAKPGTAVPAQAIACPDKLGYFANSSKGRLGCQL